jgi:NADH-quinone oxidoreductase subunit G
MSELITVKIDGKEYKAKEGEFILNVARANDIFVPAICYLTRATPTLACRLCLVEADGKQVYGCNAKVKDGMDITTVTENIVKERKAIMQVYDVNHPLQCGVCDKSGECELQDYSLYMGVDCQEYAVQDVPRPATNWGVMKYDPGLCIVCEKCVSVCKDVIGSNALSTVKRGAEPLDKSYKASMPKDAYAMWNKLNKNLIGFDESKCTDCGECIAVCPVGAMVSSDFQYQSNAWELEKIPAANPHSSDCSLIYYDVKHNGIHDRNTDRIYRVTNDSHYVSLPGMARFGYDFENRVESKDTKAFSEAIEAFKKAKNVVFNSFITNEEAMILQTLKDKYGFNLVNSDAKVFQDFMTNYSKGSGSSLYKGTLKDVHDSNFLISVGSMLKSDSQSARYAFNNAISMNKGAGLYFHPIGDPIVEGFGKKGKTIETIVHNTLAEEAILYLILDLFGKDIPADMRAYLDSFKETRKREIVETIKEKVETKTVDKETGEEKVTTKMVPKKVKKEVEYQYTKLLDTIGAEGELLATIEEMLLKKDSYSLIIGEDIITHQNSAKLAKLCGMIERYTEFKVVVIPTQTNTLGVSLICQLDDKSDGFTVGYNVSSDFELSALGDGDIDMPALNQQEGTFTNINKRVVPTNAALIYNGYELNDIANGLGLSMGETIDYTKLLPVAKGYKAINFDDMPCEYQNDFTENIGYELDICDTESDDSFDKLSDDKPLNGTVIYRANPINQVNEFTQKSHELNDKMGYYLNDTAISNLGLEAGCMVEVESNGAKVTLEVIVDNQISGDIGYISTFEKNSATTNLFKDYRFSEAKIKKV